MYISLLKSKIHRATVTQANLEYIGSITIDGVLLDSVGILEYEKVFIVNVNNGKRFETYAIRGEEGSGVMCINGAAARLAQIGDKIIIMAFAKYSEDELKNYAPKVVIVNENNTIK